MAASKVCFIGGGNMARSMLIGMLNAGFTAENIWATARTQASLDKLTALGNINATSDNIKAVKQAHIVFICVKPKDVVAVLTEIKTALTTKQIIISVATAISMQTLTDSLDTATCIIRAMPNTPVQCNQGVYGLYAGQNFTAAIKQLVTSVLELSGKTIWLHSEAELDSLTLISGCAPAYVFLLIASLEQAALKLGLPAAQAKLLAAQTVLGAGSLAVESDESALQLCSNVCSPGGLTEQGVKHLQEHAFGEIVTGAVEKTQAQLLKLLQ